MKKMTTEPYGNMIEAETLQFRRVLKGTIENVWSYLTEGKKRGQWLASGEMVLQPGGRVELIFNHERLTPHKEELPEKYREFEGESRMYGEITAIDPPVLLSHTWGEEFGVSEVTYELTFRADEDEVLLTLTHRNIGDDPDMLISILAGWHTHLDILSDKLAGKTPKPFWKTHMGLEEEYAGRLS